MKHLLWPLAVVVAFGIGWAASGVAMHSPSAAPDVEQLKQQVSTLQARLRAREDVAAPRPSGGASTEAQRVMAANVREERLLAEIGPRGGGPGPRGGGGPGERGPLRAGVAAPGPVTVDAALDRFYKYLETLKGTEGRERWQRAREIVDELRGMGDVAGKALMQVLASGTDSDERRAAARLLGQLQVPESLLLLKDIIEKDSDVLLRRAAAQGLRQLQTPESIPVMEHILANPGDDRMVRLSAAYGLAQAGRPLGVNGLTQIFNEAAADGRGRDMAFRALTSLNDDRALPFMRQVVSSGVEPGYRLRAIQYVAAQGDAQALGALQTVMNSPTEQPSVRDAARAAYRTLGGK
jgi:hypothetical protein